VALPAPSQPPPPARAKHLPPRPPTDPSQPLECSRVKAWDKRAVAIVNEVIAKRGASNVEIAEGLGCPETVVRAVRARDRRRPLKVGFALAFEKRLRVAVFQALLVEALTADDLPADADPPAHEE
jgi:hypothetical protein